jgi:uncharacterized protein YodC (DUF2158 family)
MENKINIAELLRNCPKGMELYSPIFGKVYLDKIRPHLAIVVTIDKEQGDLKEEFLYDGRYGMNGECMLFPSKNKTTWDGFQGYFKDGDIVATQNGAWIGITTGGKIHDFIPTYCVIKSNDKFEAYLEGKQKWGFARLATEEEKQKLLDAIEENGYKWNPETKTLEKFIEPKFKVGDVVQDKDGYKVEITEVNIGDECYVYLSKLLNWKGSISFNDQDKWELVPDKIEPKFKVGDRVKHKQSFISGTITNIDDDCYKIKYDSGAVSFAIIKYQDDWELVSDEIEPKFKVGNKIRLKGNPNYIYTITGIKENKSGCGVTFDLRFSEQDKNGYWFPKFDISTLVPFESKVLVRDSRDDIWRPAIFGCFNGKTPPYYVLGGIGWKYCIPYEGNEHLRGKTDDCNEYYKTW